MAAYDGDGNRVYQLNYNSDKDEDFSDYYCTNNPCDYKGTGIRLRVEGGGFIISETAVEFLGIYDFLSEQASGVQLSY